MPAADTTTHSLREGDDKDEAHTEGHQPNLAEQSRPINVETGRFFLFFSRNLAWGLQLKRGRV
jgi:hypothetical protein